MESDRKWVVVRIDGKIAGISADYRILAGISERITQKTSRKSVKKHNIFSEDYRQNLPYNEISAKVTCFEEIWEIRQKVQWDELLLFGTDFQKRVWRKLWELTHDDIIDGKGNAGIVADGVPLISYSDFAGLLDNREGVRAVAHAIGLNPISVVIPCHLVIPKETIDKIKEIREKAESTIFRGDDLCINSILNDPAIDFGEYAFGKKLKRELVIREL